MINPSKKLNKEMMANGITKSPGPKIWLLGKIAFFPFSSDVCRDSEEKQALLSYCNFHDSIT
jgi:hypothetical protein